MNPTASVSPLEERIGYSFASPGLLSQALSHRSWCAENPGNHSNERLEFLGDSLLGVVVTDYLYRTFPDLAEGQLAKVRASVVSAPTLAEVALELGIGEALRLGNGEDASGGRMKPSILADAAEAVFGALYLDGGYNEVQRLVLDCLGERITQAARQPGRHDYKTRLQEQAMRDGSRLPRYVISETGPEHNKVFRAEVSLDGTVHGAGLGASKKEAEQEAARVAWQSIREPANAHLERTKEDDV